MGIVVEDQSYDINKPAPSIELLSSYPLRNVPGFSILILRVRFLPGGASPPHRHGGAFVSAIVQSGQIYNKMNNEPTEIMGKDESWYEAPGCHHKASANVSQEEDAVILATFVVETQTAKEGGIEALVQFDEEYKSFVLPKRQLETEA